MLSRTQPRNCSSSSRVSHLGSTAFSFGEELTSVVFLSFLHYREVRRGRQDFRQTIPSRDHSNRGGFFFSPAIAYQRRCSVSVCSDVISLSQTLADLRASFSCFLPLFSVAKWYNHWKVSFSLFPRSLRSTRWLLTSSRFSFTVDRLPRLIFSPFTASPSFRSGVLFRSM